MKDLYKVYFPNTLFSCRVWYTWQSTYAVTHAGIYSSADSIQKWTIKLAVNIQWSWQISGEKLLGSVKLIYLVSHHLIIQHCCFVHTLKQSIHHHRDHSRTESKQDKCYLAQWWCVLCTLRLTERQTRPCLEFSKDKLWAIHTVKCHRDFTGKMLALFHTFLRSDVSQTGF